MGQRPRAQYGPAELDALLAPWPVKVPADWRAWVDAPQSPAEEDAVRLAVRRSRPLVGPEWVARTAADPGLGWILRPRGLPPTAVAEPEPPGG